jgi:hypothetical protein
VICSFLFIVSFFIYSVSVQAFKTHKWPVRFFTSFIGIIVTDSFFAYKHQRKHQKHQQQPKLTIKAFASKLASELFKYSTDRQTMKRRSSNAHADSPAHGHVLNSIKKSIYYQKGGKGSKTREPSLTCRVCSTRAKSYCPGCSTDKTDTTKGLKVLCDLRTTGRACFQKWHQS